MILINATTLMHKLTLSANNFGSNHFGQKYQKHNFLEFLDYNGVYLKNFRQIEQKLENAFTAKFSTLFITLKKYLWNFTSSIDASDVSVTADNICQHKIFQKLF